MKIHEVVNYMILPSIIQYNTVCGGREVQNPDTNAFSRAKLKVSVFENEQFSGHLIFEKNIFLKKNGFFWKYFFEKIKKKF